MSVSRIVEILSSDVQGGSPEVLEAARKRVFSAMEEYQKGGDDGVQFGFLSRTPVADSGAGPTVYCAVMCISSGKFMWELRRSNEAFVVTPEDDVSRRRTEVILAILSDIAVDAGDLGNSIDMADVDSAKVTVGDFSYRVKYADGSLFITNESDPDGAFPSVLFDVIRARA